VSEALHLTFVTWDGPKQPYLGSYYLPLLAALRGAEPRLRLDVVQFTWSPPEEREALAERASLLGISYVARPLWRRGGALGVAATLGAGAGYLRWHAARRGTDVWLTRSVAPGAMALGARRLGCRSAWCFDADGLAVDERVEVGGTSARAASNRALWGLEKACLRSADSLLTRTEAAARVLEARAGASRRAGSIRVVPNGADAERFAPRPVEARGAVRARFGVGVAQPWFAVLGSVGSQYLPDETLALLAELRRGAPGCALHWFSSDPAVATARLGGAARLTELGVRVIALAPSEVPDVLGCLDGAVALRRALPSQCAVSPLKLGELLLSGVPVVMTKGVGDLEDLCAGNPGTWLLADCEPRSLRDAAEWLLRAAVRPSASEAARQLGLRHFDQRRTVEGYLAALEEALRSRANRRVSAAPRS